ncbi:MAG: DUF998 domain-containing protein [Actinomycetota bacterium]
MSFRRLSAWSGIVFVVLALVANFSVGESPPGLSDSAEEVSQYFADNQDRIWFAEFVGALAIPFGLLFFVGLWFRLREGELQRGEPWSVAGLIAFGAAIGVVGAAHAAYGAAVMRGNETTGAEQVLSDIAMSAYAFSIVLLGLVLVTFGTALGRARLTPPWLTLLAYAGALLAVVGTASSGTTEDSLGFIGFIGFLVFSLWALIVSILLIRQETAPTAAATPTV